MESPGFLADEHQEGPPGNRKYLIGCPVSVIYVPDSRLQLEAVRDVGKRATGLSALPGKAFGRGGSSAA